MEQRHQIKHLSLWNSEQTFSQNRDMETRVHYGSFTPVEPEPDEQVTFPVLVKVQYQSFHTVSYNPFVLSYCLGSSSVNTPLELEGDSSYSR